MALEIFDRVLVRSPATQLVRVETTVLSGEALPAALVVSMPVWTPGSYLVREYARHVESFAVAPPATFRKVRKNAWRIEPGATTALVFSYTVYAGELTVRTNHVDETHAFFVGAALFTVIEGREDLGARIEIEVQDGKPRLLPDARKRAAATEPCISLPPRTSTPSWTRQSSLARFVRPPFRSAVSHTGTQSGPPMP